MCAGPCHVDIIVTHLAWMAERLGGTFIDASLVFLLQLQVLFFLVGMVVHISVDVCEEGVGSSLLCIPSSWHLASLSFSIASS